MPEIIGAIIGAVAVIMIPAAAWVSRRATRESRLILRVQRLGDALAVVPESDERDVFERHVTNAVAQLNAWLDPAKRALRKAKRRISGGAYAFGVALVLFTLPMAAQEPWVSTLVGVVVGVLIVAVSWGGAFFIDWLDARARAAAERKARERDLDARADRVRRGEPLVG